ncbi:hypothetical protein MPDQ_006765 [Monascus purpureus]|uniref:AMP-activated protein kinase glycogen-binding domain-containing protein n=1 Tax=Monascus purpureus TaxID=5098 RepID=A0A507QXH2_MONPU|nr:hypothetical protein MPDQ_006765 [Monascus purpureus]BDD60462.1 hypothetical protein MAP00_005587 [Monascus purpureus]
MAAIQLKFHLRTSPNVKTVHLVGSWDNYSREAPLSCDHSKPGAWTGKFRFQSSMLKSGGRYWYYYIMDGYHVSHDPAVPYTVEPTTGRKLNILDVPSVKSSGSSNRDRGSQRIPNRTNEVVRGRAPSPSNIQHPRPSRPCPLLRIPDSYDPPTMAELTKKYGGSRSQLSNQSSSSYSTSPSLSSGSSRSSSPSSVSSLTDPPTPTCCCERYGITHKGDRIKLDCNGSRCGYGSDCVSPSSRGGYYESESDEDYYQSRRGFGRRGLVIRT